jgi:hypothetical protein
LRLGHIMPEAPVRGRKSAKLGTISFGSAALASLECALYGVMRNEGSKY